MQPISGLQHLVAAPIVVVSVAFFLGLIYYVLPLWARILREEQDKMNVGANQIDPRFGVFVAAEAALAVITVYWRVDKLGYCLQIYGPDSRCPTGIELLIEQAFVLLALEVAFRVLAAIDSLLWPPPKPLHAFDLPMDKVAQRSDVLTCARSLIRWALMLGFVRGNIYWFFFFWLVMHSIESVSLMYTRYPVPGMFPPWLEWKLYSNIDSTKIK